MDTNEVRAFAYRHCVGLCAVVSGVAVGAAQASGLLPAELPDAAAAIALAVSSGLIPLLLDFRKDVMELPKSDEFVQLLNEHGYINDLKWMLAWPIGVLIAAYLTSFLHLILPSGALTLIYVDPAPASTVFRTMFLTALLLAAWASWLVISIKRFMNRTDR